MPTVWARYDARPWLPSLSNRQASFSNSSSSSSLVLRAGLLGLTEARGVSALTINGACSRVSNAVAASFGGRPLKRSVRAAQSR